jgi:VWFA-related protein
MVMAVIVATVPGRQRAPVFQARGSAVIVDVAVTDHRHPVPSLKAADFFVADEGVPQVIQAVSTNTMPLDLTLLVDTSYSIDNGWGAAIAASHHTPAGAWMASAIREVVGLLTPADRLQVVTFATAVREYNMAKPLTGRLASADGRDAAGDRTSLFDAVVAGLMQPRVAGRRHLVVALTDGFDTASAIEYTVRRDVMDRSDSAVYLIVCGNRDWSIRPTTDNGSFAEVKPYGDVGVNGRVENWMLPYGGYDWILNDIADRTAGRFYQSQTAGDFAQSLRDTLDDFRARYLLTYQPQGVSQTGWHALSVATPMNRKYEIRARRGYYAGDSGRTQ